MALGVLTLKMQIVGCRSLKEKRSRLKPFISRLGQEFNISVAEVDHQDVWQSAVVACAMITSNRRQTQRSLQKVVNWIEAHWPDLVLEDEQIELF
jgi:hypothetical protein